MKAIPYLNMEVQNIAPDSVCSANSVIIFDIDWPVLE